MVSPTSRTSLSSSFSPALLPTSTVVTSVVRNAYFSASSIKCFKRSNLKTLPTATPSFDKANCFLTGVRMLEERLAASLGALCGVRAGEKLDDKEVRLVGDAFRWENVFGCGQERFLKIVYPLAKVG